MTETMGDSVFHDVMSQRFYKRAPKIQDALLACSGVSCGRGGNRAFGAGSISVLQAPGPVLFPVRSIYSVRSCIKRDHPAMIILNEKLPPPPSYATSTSSSADGPPPFMQRRAVPKLDHLPANLLLHIVNSMFPTSAVDATHHRRTLYWLAMSLRLVSRGLYIACMHTLRSAYLASYSQLVKAPYTSDPFPAVSQAASTSPVLHSGNKETRVLDLYIALKVREDVWMDETELHLEREESFKDLFDLMQPRSRTEDLVGKYGGDAKLITMSSVSGRSVTPIPFDSLTVNFSQRKVGLVLFSGGSKRTIVECSRERGEKLELSAKRLVKELARWARA